RPARQPDRSSASLSPALADSDWRRRVSAPSTDIASSGSTGPAADQAVTLRVIKRSGVLSEWDPSKISAAITKAFLAVEGPSATGSTRVHDVVDGLTTAVVESLTRRADGTRALHIEDIQDQVELALMRAGYQKVARAYVLYREARAEARRSVTPAAPVPAGPVVTRRDGTRAPLDEDAWRRQIA